MQQHCNVQYLIKVQVLQHGTAVLAIREAMYIRSISDLLHNRDASFQGSEGVEQMCEIGDDDFGLLMRQIVGSIRLCHYWVFPISANPFARGEINTQAYDFDQYSTALRPNSGICER